MQIQRYDIVPALQPFIKLICSMDCGEDADTAHIRVLPDACVELFINYTSTPVAVIDNELHNRSIISFRMSRPIDVQMRKGAGCLAICFYPGMAYNFFNIPMHLLSDTTAALSDIWGGLAMEIEDKLAHAYNIDMRVDIVQTLLFDRLVHSKRDFDIFSYLRQADLAGNSLSISEFTRISGLGQRQLSRKFQQYIGLSPKEYLRVCRFIKSLAHLKKYPQRLSLTEIGYESGYYDQAHFIRDCKAFSGHTPGEVASAAHIVY